MKWQELQDTLQSVIQEISDLEGNAVYWDALPGGFIPDAWVRLSIGDVRKLGVDETRYVMDLTDTLVPVYREVRYGIRMVNVLIKVESRNQNLINNSQAIADRIKTRLFKTNIQSQINTETGAAISTITDVRTIDRLDKNTGRTVSYSVFELNLSTYTEDIDTSTEGTSWIETVEINQSYCGEPGVIQEYQVGMPIQIGAIYTQDGQSWLATQDGFVLITQ